MTTGAGSYFDGVISVRRAVAIETAPDGLHIRDTDGALITTWPYSEIEALPAPHDILRLGRIGSAALARLEIRDARLATEIDVLAEGFDRSGRSERRLRRRIVLWSLAATASLVLVGVFGLPALSDRIAPLIPMSVEHQLGVAMDAQVRAMLDDGRSGRPFECGGAANEKRGLAAFDQLVAVLQKGANLPIPLKVTVVRRREANAIALPGGHIYVFEGLVQQARSADELAGVIAHEIGHVAHRDGTRSLLQSAGLSFLFGMLLGDFTGGGVVVIAARVAVQSAYSREAETAADLYGVRLMAQAGGDARAFAAILDRIAGTADPGIGILRDHPQTKDRVAATLAAAKRMPPAKTALLPPDDWLALKQICG